MSEASGLNVPPQEPDASDNRSGRHLHVSENIVELKNGDDLVSKALRS